MQRNGPKRDTQHLEQRRRGWYCVAYVPERLHRVIGKRRLMVSLRTRSLSAAQQRRWPALDLLRGRMAAAAHAAGAADTALDQLATDAAAWRASLERLERGDLTGFSTSRVPDHGQTAAEQALSIVHWAIDDAADRMPDAAEAGRFLRLVREPAVVKVQLPSFRQAAAEYIAAHRAGWRGNASAVQWTNSLEQYAYGVIGELAPDAITTEHVLTVLRELWTRAPETASRVRGRIESVLDYAATRGWRTGENPARWKGHLQHLLPKSRRVAVKQHLPALPWQEMVEFMAELMTMQEIGALALRFTVLTAGRSGEVLGMKWREIDWPARVWTVPGERMKAGREHRVPLSDAAISVLQEMQRRRLPRHGDFVFPAERKAHMGLYETAMRRVLAGLRPGVSVHGFRSSFRDWCSEGGGNWSGELAEMALAHTVGGAVERAYRRGDLLEKRRALMDAWAGYCGGAS